MPMKMKVILFHFILINLYIEFIIFPTTTSSNSVNLFPRSNDMFILFKREFMVYFNSFKDNIRFLRIWFLIQGNKTPGIIRRDQNYLDSNVFIKPPDYFEP